MKKFKSSRQILLYILIMFSILVVFGLFFLPLLNVVIMAFQEEGRFSFGLFTQLFTSKKTLRVIGNTLYINIWSSLFAAILGVSTAYAMAYTDIRGKKLLNYALLLPLIIPGYIITLAWMQFFAKNGSVATLIRQFIPGMKMPNIYSYWGIILVFAVTKYPVIYSLALSTFRKISVDMELAASVSGCSRIKTFFKVTLPMSASGLANGLLLVFIACLDNFGTVSFLGIPARILVLSTDIYQSVVSMSGNNFGVASAKSIILGVIGILFTLILLRFAKLFDIKKTEIEDMNPRIFLGKKKIIVESLIWLFILLVNLVPFITLIQTSLIRGIGAGWTRENMTLSNYAYIFSNAKSLNAIKNSVFLGLTTVIICVVIGTVVAYLVVRKPKPLIKIIDTTISVPYSLPGIIVGIALIITWARPLPIINKTIYGTVFMLLVSYVVRFASMQIRSSSTAFLQLDPSMEEAAQVSGAGALKKWLFIIIPLIFPATFSGVGLVFISALTELTTSSLLWSAGSETIGVVVYNYTSAGQTTIACALSVLVLVTILFLVLVYLGASAFARKVRSSIK